jgi:dTDP-4-dehydrorhamnose reductase
MKVAIVGANGQLGTDLVDVLAAAGLAVVPLGHDEIEVATLGSVREALATHHPDAVLNTAAFHNMPRCEEDPARAFAVNAVGALNLARVTSELGARNVYFSTDYVFDGAKGEPYEETDRPLPLNVYGASKLAGERLSETYAPGSLVLRVSGLYGRVPCRDKGENFITKMVELAGSRPEVRVVTDEILTPTSTRAIAEKTLELLRTDAAGLMHLTCEGSCSWHEFAREIFSTLELETPLREATVADFPSPVERPHYSVLANIRLAEAGLAPMPHWREALHDFLAREHSATVAH